MKKTTIKKNTSASVRNRAEKLLKTRESKASVKNRIQAELHALVHELQVHQVELEMQNAELQVGRDRMEEVLEKYTDLFDFAPVGYFSLDETGVILEVNLMGTTLLGVERSRLINRRLPGFIAPENQPGFLAFLKRVFAGTGKQFCEAPLVKENGSTFWAGCHGTAALTASGPRKWCRVSVSDISSVKQAEEVLRRNEALFSALVQQAPVGVYVVDDQFRLQQVNPRAAPAFSTIQPLAGRDFSEVVHRLWPKKTADEIVDRFRRTLKTGQPYYAPEFSDRRADTGVTESYEWEIQRLTLPDGRHGVVCFFSDITERKQAEATQLRVEVLAASNRKLEEEIVRRRAVEKALKNSERYQRRLHWQLRQLSHQILRAGEEERKRISRELHDQVAQTLVGLNVHLESLSREATIRPEHLRERILSMQQLVGKSVEVVHQFARNLRPTVLDDLGLVPALNAFIKEYSERTGIQIQFTPLTPGRMNELDSDSRTVLYRIAQSALINVAQHALADRVNLSIRRLRNGIQMKIKDGGVGFDVDEVLAAKRHQRLGILGMRERVEMVGGQFAVKSVPGHGTTITAKVPFGTRSKQGKTRLSTKPA